jgi:hypothetical protein
MAWNIKGTMIEFCSCRVLCPCWLGPDTKPDQGWCSGAIAYDIREGAVDGVDVAGCKAVFAAEWPGNFFGGKGKARLYLDSGASADQRRALEAVFSGKKGGLFEGLLGAVISSWLPAKTVPIAIRRGDALAVSVGDVGKATIASFRDRPARPPACRALRRRERSKAQAWRSRAARRRAGRIPTCGPGKATPPRFTR